MVSFDAENAFDSVRWDYLYMVLERFGFNSQVIGCRKSLYCSPTVKIKINGGLSKTVSLKRGCRQGCPPSPSLFVFFMEPLARAIRENQNIKGVSVGDSEYKIYAHADDILMTLINPNVRLPGLLSLFDKLAFILDTN